MPESQLRCRIFSSRLQFVAVTVLMLMSLLFSIAWITKMEPLHLNSLSSRFGLQDEFDVKMASRHKRRTQRIEEHCAEYGKNSSWKELDFSNFIVVEKYKMVCCSVPKVACTIWKRILAKLEGWNITAGVHKYTKDKLKFLQNYSLQDRRKILNTYTKFMFVREPFERLLSGYRDCFWGEWKRKHDYWKEYRRKIGRWLQKGAGLKIDLKADNITFAEFATYLGLRRKVGREFQEHWREQYKLCHPCNIHYDVVGHYETFLEDAQFILRKTKTEGKVSLPTWQPTDTSVLLNSYYSSFSLQRIRQLERIYKRDFELFGYSRPGPLQSLVDKLKQFRL